MIRIANASDSGSLATLKRDTFRETFVEGFGIQYRAEDLAAYEVANYSEEIVREQLHDPERKVGLSRRLTVRCLATCMLVRANCRTLRSSAKMERFASFTCVVMRKAAEPGCSFLTMRSPFLLREARAQSGSASGPATNAPLRSMKERASSELVVTTFTSECQRIMNSSTVAHPIDQSF